MFAHGRRPRLSFDRSQQALGICRLWRSLLPGDRCLVLHGRRSLLQLRSQARVGLHLPAVSRRPGRQFTFSPAGQKDSGFLGKINTCLPLLAGRPGLWHHQPRLSQRQFERSNHLVPTRRPFVCGQPNELLYTPDKTTNYEVGLKTQWLDRRLTFNAVDLLYRLAGHPARILHPGWRRGYHGQRQGRIQPRR